MASGAEARFTRVNLALVLVAGALTAWATAGALRAQYQTPSSDRTAALGFEFPVTRYDRLGAFWIGAWCAPPARATTAEAWTRFADAGIDVGIYPLEDRFRREDNLARLALLDSLNLVRSTMPGARPIYAIVRDDSLHPDETLRPDWEGRLERARALYSRHPSCVAMFLADEPPLEVVRVLAPIARASTLGADSLPSMFVNFIGLPPHPTLRQRDEWRRTLETSIREAELPFFTVNSYASEERGGETPNFLLALEDVARVAYENGRRFGWLVQVTGHGTLDPATPGQARMRVFEALAHGATAIVWFTYWTPNPSEERWRWRDGLVDYATGAPTAQYAMVRDVNDAARRCATWWGVGGFTGVAHLGGDLPPGADALAARRAQFVPGLVRTRGGPLTIGWRGAHAGWRRLLIVNRDVERERTVVLTFDARLMSMVFRSVPFDEASHFGWDGSDATVSLPPGGAIGLECMERPSARTAGAP